MELRTGSRLGRNGRDDNNRGHGVVLCDSTTRRRARGGRRSVVAMVVRAARAEFAAPNNIDDPDGRTVVTRRQARRLGAGGGSTRLARPRSRRRGRRANVSSSVDMRNVWQRAREAEVAVDRAVGVEARPAAGEPRGRLGSYASLLRHPLLMRHTAISVGETAGVARGAGARLARGLGPAHVCHARGLGSSSE